MLMFDYADVDNCRQNTAKKILVRTNSGIVSGLHYIKQICKGDFWNSEYDTNIWHSMFRKDFMIENELFSPEISYCEDMIVALRAIVFAKRVQSIPEDYYRYRYNSMSVLHTQVGRTGRTLFDGSIFAGTEL